MIEAKNLMMSYGATLALDDVSFSVGDKEVVGLLGPNGAGKSTLMRILTTFIYPAQGTAQVAGFDILQNPHAVRKVIGYLPENPPLYLDMRVDEFVEFVAAARGVSGRLLKKRKDWVIEAVKIAPVLKHNIYELSLGYRQRVGLAQALIHDPKVVILDEPTSGLDPMQIVGIRKLIKDLSSEKSIIFSTHILQEAAAISNRLLIIDQGKIIAQGTPLELKKRHSSGVDFVISYSAARSEVEAALKNSSAFKKVTLIEETAGVAKFICGAISYDDAAFGANSIAKEKGWILKELYFKEPTLEEVFLDLFKK